MSTSLSTTPTTAVSSGIPGAEWLTPATMEQGMKLAEMMAKCTLVPDHLKNKPGDCFPILVQALRWRMDPFAVAQATAVVKGKLCYEGKLVHAVLISMGVIDGRLSFDYEGNGDARSITVTGTPRGDKPRSITGTVRQWKTENSMWTKDPDMILAYRGTRAWARLYCPDAMLGVYTPDEAAEIEPREVEATVHADPKPAKRRSAAAVEKDNCTAQGTTSQAGYVTAEDKAEDEAERKAQEQAAAEQKPAEQDKPDISADRCVAEFSKLWKHSEAGKTSAKAIQAKWALAKIADLAGASDDDRAAFLDEVSEALAKVEG